MLNIEPRDLAPHYKAARNRLETPPKLIDVIDEQATRIAELENENKKFRDYLIRCNVNPCDVLEIPVLKTMEVQFNEIMRSVCDHFGVNPIEIKSARRQGYLLMPRHIICYLARHLTLLSMPQIGRKLGNRDHTTILHADRRIRRLMAANDPMVIMAVQAISAKLARARDGSRADDDR